MNKGKIVASLIVLSGVVAGGLLWWTENYAYYEPVSAGALTIRATTFDGVADPLPVADLQAIDADTSPLRFRACFTTPLSLAMMSETYQPYEGATPLNTPGWFDCYDAGALAQAMEDGSALAFLGEENFVFGFDRIVLVTEDGRGFAWHQINHCGEAVYDGDPAPAGCPPAPERN
jgi:hypothetical protein